MDDDPFDISPARLESHFKKKFDLATVGWGPKRRLKHRYFLPTEHYEVLLDNLVNSKTNWVDVGGGRAILPGNVDLSKRLAQRSCLMIAVDPSSNVLEHPFAHERHACMLENFQTDHKFSLATFRMVAEHVEDPGAVILKLKELIEPRGLVVIYTIYKFSPIPLFTALVPFSWHFRIKNFFWGGESRDTFPVAYKMNTRGTLKSLFESNGFEEVHFSYLDDLSAFGNFRFLNAFELLLWRALKLLGLPYPEVNILGVYQRH